MATPSTVTPCLPIRARRALLPAGALLLALAGCDDPTGPRVAELEITAPYEHLDIGQSLDLSAAARGASGDAVDRRLTWSSSNRAVAEVVDGRVTGRSPGEVYVRAAAGKVADSVRLVVETPVAQIRIAPDSVSLLAGRSGKLFVETVDTAGRAQAHSLYFSSSVPAVVSVDVSGEVKALVLGSATVTVRAGTRSVEVPVRVVTGERYTVRPLGTLGGDASEGFGINNRTEVVGSSNLAAGGARRAFLWRQGRMTDLGLLRGHASAKALAVNDRGTVVGSAEMPTGGFPRTTPWIVRSGTLSAVDLPGERLDPFPGYYVWIGEMDVNARDQVTVEVITVTSGGGTWSGARSLLVQNGTATLLNYQASHGVFYPSTAPAVNDQGVVVVTTYGFTYHGLRDPKTFLWSNGQYTPGPVGMFARDLNTQGVVAGACAPGSTYSGTIVTLGCTWDGTRRRDFAELASLNRINAHGEMLGVATGGGAVLVRDGQVLRLGDLVGPGDWEIQAAAGINDLGQIVATGKHRSTGQVQALLLTPA
ncbi:MAG TPA: Ig-like domain-containing protein [Longimicrobiaceae bacterium]|nr:Ig-like domain-containing protein [Longimicrobiaceae bacterium]